MRHALHMGRVALATLCLTATAAAAAASVPDKDLYETERLTRALDAMGLTVSPLADGKPIGAIHVVRRDVFAEDEFIPTFLNVFHWLTKESVIRRELLFVEGDRFSPAQMDESMRNLRDMGIFSVVRIVAVETPSPDIVDVVVFTRDLWSLRAETGFQVTDGLIDDLSVTLIERNLLGLNKQAALRGSLTPKTWSIGELYLDRRLFGGHWALSQSFDLIFRRSDSTLEGSQGLLSVGIPLYDLATEWGFVAAVAYEDFVARQVSGGDVLGYDVPETEEVEAYGRVWDQTVVSASVTGTYQTGEAIKHRVGFGFAGSTSVRTPNRESALPAGEAGALARAAFARDVLAPDRTQLYPFIQWSGFESAYTTFSNLAGFGLTEDVRTGPHWELQFSAPLDAFGSSSDSLVFSGEAGWVWAIDDALIDVEIAAATRLEASRFINRQLRARLRGASPKLPFGRLVGRLEWEGRDVDTTRTLVTLGGDNGLRGYASQRFFAVGANRLRLNLELRTPPLVWKSAHLGAVCFYDAGEVYDALSNFQLRQSAGVGLRLLFPQFNRFVLRVDVGAPLDGDGFTVLLTFGSLQAVPLTAVEDLKMEE